MYYSGRFESIWFIISTSSMFTLIFLLPWNKPNYIIQSSMSLLILLFVFLYLFHGRIFYYTAIVWKFLFNFSHACSALLLGKYSVNDSSMIWKNTFSSYAKIRLFCTLSLIWLSILSSLIFYTVLSTRFLTFILRIILQEIYHTLSNNFHGNIQH